MKMKSFHKIDPQDICISLTVGMLIGFVCYKPVRADEIWAVGTVRSYHIDRTHNYNERNWGVGMEVDRWITGEYKNSFGHTSAYLGYHYLPYQTGNWHLGLSGVLVTGYNNSLLFAVTPSILYETQTFGVNLLVPLPLGVAIQLKWKL